MSSIVSKLTATDKKALALFYETPTYSSFLKLLKLAKANAAMKCLDAIDFNQVKHLQGQKAALEAIEGALKEIYKLDQKR